MSSVKRKRNNEQVQAIDVTNMARERDAQKCFYLVTIDLAALKHGELSWV